MSICHHLRVNSELQFRSLSSLNEFANNYSNLFHHWFIAFGYVYSCSQVTQFPNNSTGSGARNSDSYIHKFMNLNQTDVGYFIRQLTLASQYFGFTETDSSTLETFMNARYNVRCQPPIDGELYSICLADDCPLAVLLG